MSQIPIPNVKVDSQNRWLCLSACCNRDTDIEIEVENEASDVPETNVSCSRIFTRIFCCCSRPPQSSKRDSALQKYLEEDQKKGAIEN